MAEKSAQTGDAGPKGWRGCGARGQPDTRARDLTQGWGTFYTGSALRPWTRAVDWWDNSSEGPVTNTHSSKASSVSRPAGPAVSDRPTARAPETSRASERAAHPDAWPRCHQSGQPQRFGSPNAPGLDPIRLGESRVEIEARPLAAPTRGCVGCRPVRCPRLARAAGPLAARRRHGRNSVAHRRGCGKG